MTFVILLSHRTLEVFFDQETNYDTYFITNLCAQSFVELVIFFKDFLFLLAKRPG